MNKPKAGFLFGCMLWCILAPHGLPCSAAGGTALPPDHIVGETLEYAVSFWLLQDAAQGELCLAEAPGGYRAYFEASSKGVLRLLSGQRRETMESIMEYDPAGQRLRPRVFTETFTHRSRVFQRRIVFDYERGTFTCTRLQPGARPQVTRAPLPSGPFEDLLSLYYNFRLGAYGPLRSSGTLRVPVIMKEQPSLVLIEFPAPGSPERTAGFNAVLGLERTLTHALSRRLLTGIDASGLLEKALIVDAYLFGDLSVRLRRVNYNAD